MQQGPTSSEVTLTERELDVLKLLVDGKSVNEISQILHISKNTVNSHRTNIMVKLNCETIVDLIRYSIRKGFFEFDK
ncbi:Oxygen regulatory protein NreC [bioreactor metagenome]|uniref:Oxygen regulatory protein NreC n=2 Tax=root TaxID=1 RepID=A0A645JIU6_9ZZZZ